MIEAYPLYWPEGRPRASHSYRETAKFKASFARARDDVLHEIELLVGRYTVRQAEIIISTNVALRRDGLPLANQRQPDDPGVAVYFTYKKKQVCFACDRWTKIEDNMRAIALTIAALRGIARWGTGDMMEAAFRGFSALPAPGATTRTWRVVLELGPGERNLDVARDRYRRLASLRHPDKGVTTDAMTELNAAWDQAQKELAR
jgi:hypothetical protein